MGELDVLDPNKKVAKGGVTIVNVKKTKAMMEIDRKNAEEKRKELELKKQKTTSAVPTGPRTRNHD